MFLGYFAIFLGVVLCLVGGLFVFAYLWEAIIVRMGEADQSLLFWYSPLLLFGILGVIGGFAILSLGKDRLTKQRDDERAK